MKLFRRIYLQVFLGMLSLAVCLLFFSVRETGRQGLLQARRYGIEQTERGVRRLREKNAEEKIGVLEEKIQDIAVSSEFQEYFGSGGVLWRGGRELRNTSPYILDLNLLEDMRKKEGVSETDIFAAGPFSVKGKRLLICYGAKADLGMEESYSLAAFFDVTEIYDGMHRLILWGMLLGGILLLLIGILLCKRIYRLLKPMQELKAGAAAIAGGDLGSRILVRGKDEIGDVTESFNQMAGQVESHTRLLEETNEKQKQLLGSLAHEMKTPLTAMIGNADLLLTVQLKEEQRERALSYILEEARRLSRLSEKMLELTGLYENGGAGAVMKEVKISRLFKRLEASAAFRLKEKEIGLETRTEKEGLSHRMDEDLMESLLLNLVDNACKASAPGSRIVVSADEGGIFVQDFGRGIPEAEIGRVTEAFYMVDKARGRSAGGSGLGLALCKQIAGIHGAKLLIESRMGEGTRVSFLWK